MLDLRDYKRLSGSIAQIFVCAFLFTTMSLLGSAKSNECGANYFPGPSDEYELHRIPVQEVETFINNNDYSDGILIDVSSNDDNMWVDVVSIPGTTRVVASIRVLWMIGRLADPSYTDMVLSDEGDPIFVIPGETIRSIGCQFLWGVEGGQNPISLIRLMVNSMTRPNGQRVAPPFTGSLLGDTTTALRTLNEVVYPEWLLGDLRTR